MVAEAPVLPTVTAASVPANLPTGNIDASTATHAAPVVGYQNVEDIVASESVVEADVPLQAVPKDMQELEDRAHQHHVLISSEAMQHFVSVCHQDVDRVAFLDRVLTEAQVTYPTEDGWVVLNCERMQELTKLRQERNERPVIATDQVVVAPEVKKEKGVFAPETPDLPATTIDEPAPVVGSLAEAVLLGNVVNAYQLIDRRPMIALAEAAADLDALYRFKQGEKVVVSDWLQNHAEAVTTAQVSEAITALTSALDGTYADETAAVKMAILKAIKAVSVDV